MKTSAKWERLYIGQHRKRSQLCLTSNIKMHENEKKQKKYRKVLNYMKKNISRFQEHLDTDFVTCKILSLSIINVFRCVRHSIKKYFFNILVCQSKICTTKLSFKTFLFKSRNCSGSIFSHFLSSVVSVNLPLSGSYK